MKEAKIERFSPLSGATDVTRTHDLLITNQLLYRLSYSSTFNFLRPGLVVTNQLLYRLSYTSIWLAYHSVPSLEHFLKPWVIIPQKISPVNLDFEWLPFFEHFYRKTEVVLPWKLCNYRAFLFRGLCVRLPDLLKFKIFFSTEGRYIDSFIEKMLRRRFHIPAAFCTLESYEGGFHWKTEHISLRFCRNSAPRCIHGDMPLLFWMWRKRSPLRRCHEASLTRKKTA